MYCDFFYYNLTVNDFDSILLDIEYTCLNWYTVIFFVGVLIFNI